MTDINSSNITPEMQAAFEAGIKLGALYHQFIGSPVSPESAGSLERSMSEAMGVQPYVRSADVSIDREELDACLNDFGYASLSEKMLKASVVIDLKGAEVSAELGWDPNMEYPLMKITDLKRPNE